MQPFHLESITVGADCAVLRVSGEVDVYTAPQLRERVIELLADTALTSESLIYNLTLAENPTSRSFPLT